MTIEEKLKMYILTKYHSIREFTMEIDLPYSTMATILKRGIENSNVNNIIKICQALKISADELAAGNIVPLPVSNDPEVVALEDITESAKQKLNEAKEVTLDGVPIKKDMLRRFIAYFDLLIEMEKRNDLNDKND